MRLLVILVVLGAASAFKTYKGYELIEVTPTNEPQLTFLHNLAKNADEAFDFWESPSRVGQAVVMLLSPDQLTKYKPQFHYHRLPVTVVHTGIDRAIMDEKARLDERKTKAFNISDFNTIEDINNWLQGDALTKCSNANLNCSVESIGLSFEGKEVYMISISAGQPGGKKGIYMDALTHSREWLTTATTLYLMDNMFNEYPTDADVAHMLDTYNWHFVHVVNPDGYNHTWGEDRLFRKNRNTNYCASGSNIGVDLNRNYDFKWGTNGVSHQECNDQFCGPNGNSEPEIQNVANWLRAKGGNYLWTVITAHSYGSYMLHPWGTTTGWDQENPDIYPCDLSDDHADLDAVSVAGCNAIEATYDTFWRCGNSCETIYTTSGATDDYAKGVCGVKYAYNPELRGPSFIAPPSDIPISFNEFWNGVVAMIYAIELNPPLPVATPKA